MKVMSIFGTRPEAIKMCPLIKKMEENSEIDSIVCLTGQHKEMLQQVINVFGIDVKYNLNIMETSQTITSITNNVLKGLDSILILEEPDIILVHGDTTTSFAAALSAYYHKISIGHVEAGLRTNNKYSPFPEEINRKLISSLADIHFSPTERNKDNLNHEGVNKNVFVTGNTVIDSMKLTIRDEYIFHNSELNNMDLNKYRYILLTTHRRENIGQPMKDIFQAIRKIIEDNEDIVVIYPIHKNPVIRDIAYEAFENCNRIHLIEPLDVEDMHNLISKSYLVLTDSGGLQEEAPFCGVPVIVLRNDTERVEAVEAGTVLLAGTSSNSIVLTTQMLLDNIDKYNIMSKAINPYGIGNSCDEIIKRLLIWNEIRND